MPVLIGTDAGPAARRTTRVSAKFAELEPPIQIRITAGAPELAPF